MKLGNYDAEKFLTELHNGVRIFRGAQTKDKTSVFNTIIAPAIDHLQDAFAKKVLSQSQRETFLNEIKYFSENRWGNSKEYTLAPAAMQTIETMRSLVKLVEKTSKNKESCHKIYDSLSELEKITPHSPKIQELLKSHEEQEKKPPLKEIDKLVIKARYYLKQHPFPEGAVKARALIVKLYSKKISDINKQLEQLTDELDKTFKDYIESRLTELSQDMKLRELTKSRKKACIKECDALLSALKKVPLDQTDEAPLKYRLNRLKAKAKTAL